MKQVNNKCDLDVAIASSPTQTGRASVHRAAVCHEQTRRVAPPCLDRTCIAAEARRFETKLNTLAGQLVKHLQALRFGVGDYTVPSQRVMQLSRF